MNAELNSPSIREEISHRARELWHLAGEPRNRDPEFWFAAEARVDRERRELERAKHELPVGTERRAA